MKRLFYIRLGERNVPEFLFWTGRTWSNAINKINKKITPFFAKKYTFEEAQNVLRKRWPKNIARYQIKNNVVLYKKIIIVPINNAGLTLKVTT